jgi:futalosine hydrolase
MVGSRGWTGLLSAVMEKAHPFKTDTGRVLLVVAAPAEARAVLDALGGGALEAPVSGPWRLVAVSPAFDLVLTGVGKANAAAGVARVLDPNRHGAVLNLGIAGALPRCGVSLGSLLVATASVYADEGLDTPDGFTDCAGLGFPLGPFPGSAISADPRLLERLTPLTDIAAPIATVSTCSGTDALASRVASRTGAAAEAMEGAAVGQVAARLGIPFAEVRAISNTTGDRGNQRWELQPAFAALTRLIGRLSTLH